MDEQTFLKKRRQRIVEVGGLGKSPQLLGDLGSFGREAEKIRQHSESLADALFQFRLWNTRQFSIFGCHGPASLTP